MAADIFRYFGGVAGEQKGETLPLGEDLLSYTVREPLGVVAGIVPWNAPVMLAALKVAMALCTGNTLVLKAAEDAPLGVLKMAEVCWRHLPEGVLQVVTGYGEETGGALLNHPGIAKITFTGSTEVGKIAMRAAAERILPVSLELGGKSPAIVYPDSGDDATVQHVITAMRFARQGQSCTAGSRLFVHASIYEDFVARLSAALEQLVVGRRAGRGVRHRVADQRDAGRARVRLRAGGARAGRGRADGRAPGRVAPRLPAPAHRARRRRPVLARLPRGGLRPGARRAAVGGRGRGDPLGQRHPLRPRGVRVLARHQPRAARRPPDRGRLGAGQPQRRPAARA